jgi:hypothetical protein
MSMAQICGSISWENGHYKVLAAKVRTNGAVKNFLFWDVFKELLVTQPVLHRFR